MTDLETDRNLTSTPVSTGSEATASIEECDSLLPSSLAAEELKLALNKVTCLFCLSFDC